MTVNELRAALDKLVAERPECGDYAVEILCAYDSGFAVVSSQISAPPAVVDSVRRALLVGYDDGEPAPETLAAYIAPGEDSDDADEAARVELARAYAPVKR